MSSRVLAEAFSAATALRRLRNPAADKRGMAFPAGGASDAAKTSGGGSGAFGISSAGAAVEAADSEARAATGIVGALREALPRAGAAPPVPRRLENPGTCA